MAGEGGLRAVRYAPQRYARAHAQARAPALGFIIAGWRHFERDYV